MQQSVTLYCPTPSLHSPVQQAGERLDRHPHQLDEGAAQFASTYASELRRSPLGLNRPACKPAPVNRPVSLLCLQKCALIVLSLIRTDLGGAPRAEYGSLSGLLHSEGLKVLHQGSIGPRAPEGPHALQVSAVATRPGHSQHCVGIAPALAHRKAPAHWYTSDGTMKEWLSLLRGVIERIADACYQTLSGNTEAATSVHAMHAR